jgi:hypothetical protein
MDNNCNGRTYEIGDTGTAIGIVLYMNASGQHSLGIASQDIDINGDDELQWGCYEEITNNSNDIDVNSYFNGEAAKEVTANHW